MRLPTIALVVLLAAAGHTEAQARRIAAATRADDCPPRPTPTPPPPTDPSDPSVPPGYPGGPIGPG